MPPDDLAVKLAEFTGKVTEWMETTKNYRKEHRELIESNQDCLKEKIDKLKDSLPCLSDYKQCRVEKKLAEIKKDRQLRTPIIVGVVMGAITIMVRWIFKI